MKLTTDSFAEGAPIPAEFAFGAIDPTTHVRLAANRNPQLTWTEVPDGTQSFALIMRDPDAPSRGDDVNQEGKTVPASLPRVDFFHWVLIDLPAELREIATGSHSDGVTPHGKPGPLALDGAPWRQGLNDYTGWFAADAAMAGDYHGYDGPCPPWNDSIVHRYVFTLYALDVLRLDVPNPLDGKHVRQAMEGHILASASVMGTYTLNPALAASDH